MIIFVANRGLLVHIVKKKKDILILCKDSTDRLNNTRLTTEKEFSITFTNQQKKVFFSLHYNPLNSHTFNNSIEINKFKPKNFEINAAPLCFIKFSKYFSVNNTRKVEYFHTCITFQLIMIRLTLMIFYIFISI